MECLCLRCLVGRVFEYLAFTNPTLPILNAQGFDTVVKTLSNALKDEPHIANRVGSLLQ